VKICKTQLSKLRGLHDNYDGDRQM